ncbi:MAG: HD domain-containing protein [Syntrophaceae bacterium]|nr:HD domain-containing protein [Syntrophaceae bacterium]
MNENAIRLLMFEDNPGDVALIREQLSESGGFFEILSFDLLSQGLEFLATNNVDVVLLDLGLPDSQGLNTIEMVMAKNPSVPIIILTGLDDEKIAMEAVRRGAQDYLIKGSASIEILARIIHYSMERKNAEKELKLSIERFSRALSDTVKAMAMAVEIRDPYTAGHQRRGAGLARAIALEMRLDPRQIEGVQLACMIHDIGKISIPSEILSKPCLLSSLEISLIKVHPQVGYDILKEIDFPWPIAQAVLQHHERIDGSGYPEGLKNSDIILEARILAVADVVEAISSHRPYRPAFGLKEALSEIDRKQGILYDPVVVKSCLKLFQDKNYVF